MSAANPPQTHPHPDPLVAIDLSDLPADKMAALRRAAISAGVSLSAYLAGVIAANAQRLIGDPPGQAAHACGADQAAA